MISVIIPAYNAEQTIERAIISAIRQIPDSEVIVALNGCTDQTEEIVKKLAAQNANVKPVYSEKGVSVARNTGIEQASGEWLMFLDADDYYEDNSQQSIQRCLENTAIDLWVFGHKSGNEERRVIDGTKIQTFENSAVLNARVMMLQNPTRYMQAWGKLYRADIIKQNDLRFNTTMTLSEDSDFTLRYSKYCSGIGFVPDVIYHYSLIATSTMRQNDGSKVRHYTDAMEKTRESVSGEPEAIRKAFQTYVLMHMNIAMVREVFAVGNTNSKAEKKALMKQTASEKIFADAISSTKKGECFSLRMAPILFLKMHLDGCAALVYSTRAKQNARREGLL